MLSRIVKTKRGRVVTLVVALVLSFTTLYVGSYLLMTEKHPGRFDYTIRLVDYEWQRIFWFPLVMIEKSFFRVHVQVIWSDELKF